jgi:hypothetical protein
MLNWLRRSEDVAQSAQRHWVFAFWLALAVQDRCWSFLMRTRFSCFPAACSPV